MSRIDSIIARIHFVAALQKELGKIENPNETLKQHQSDLRTELRALKELRVDLEQAVGAT